jgi:hypothetical protein
MPSRTCASPGNKYWHSRPVNKCICVAGSTWGTRGCTTSPQTCGPRRSPLASFRGRAPSVVGGGGETLDYWQEVRKLFPLPILLCMNRLLPTPPQQQSSLLWSPPLQGNSAAMQRYWMTVGCSNLNGLAGNISAETSLGCRPSLKKGQSVSFPQAAAAPPPLVRAHYSVAALVFVVGAISPPLHHCRDRHCNGRHRCHCLPPPPPRSCCPPQRRDGMQRLA